jgi:hypothetical protein
MLVAALTTADAVVERHSDHFPDDIPDEGWLPLVGSNRWGVLTNDKRIRHRRIERESLLAAGIRAFVLTAGQLSGAAAADLPPLNGSISGARIQGGQTLGRAIDATWKARAGRSDHPQAA